MKLLQKTAIAAMVALVSLGASAFDTNNPAPKPPTGWSLIEDYKNVKIYRKGSENTFVQVVDMSQGAHVKMYQYGAGTHQPSGQPTYWINTIKYWWDQTGSPTTSAVSVVNGQFFDFSLATNASGQKDPVVLAYGVKSAGTVLTNGGDVNANGNYPLKQMSFFANMPSVSTWTTSSLRNTAASNAIVGLDRRANRDSTSNIGRNYLCAKPYASNMLRQSISLLVVYQSDKKSQANANTDLNNWDCSESNTVMMDGSGSSQLHTKGGGTRIGGVTFRKTPQAIGIFN